MMTRIPLSPAIAGALPKGEPLNVRNLRSMGLALCFCNTKAKLAINLNLFEGEIYGKDYNFSY